MVDVEVQTLIRRPRHDVADYACNPDNATAWYVNITAVRWQTPAPVSLGSRCAFTAEGPFPMETIYAWDDGPDGATLMTLRNRGEPSGFFRIASPVLSMAMKRANNSDLERLKLLLEAP